MLNNNYYVGANDVRHQSVLISRNNFILNYNVYDDYASAVDGQSNIVILARLSCSVHIAVAVVV